MTVHPIYTWNSQLGIKLTVMAKLQPVMMPIPNITYSAGLVPTVGLLVPLRIVPLRVVPLRIVPLRIVPLHVVPLGIVPLGVVQQRVVPLRVVRQRVVPQ